MARGTLIGCNDRYNIPVVQSGSGCAWLGARIKMDTGIPAAKRTIRELLFPFNGEGSSPIGGRDPAGRANGNGYGNGNLGTLHAILCLPKANGDPDVDNPLRSFSGPFATNYNNTVSRWGVGGPSLQVCYVQFSTEYVVPDGGIVWVVWDGTVNSNANYYSTNFSDMRDSPASGAPNFVNSYATPNAPGAVGGMDTVECLASSQNANEPRTWSYNPNTAYRCANQLAWSATAGTTSAAPSTPYYGFAPWTGGNNLTGSTETTPTVPSQALNIPITSVKTCSPGSPGTITVAMWDTATNAAVPGQSATASITQSGFRSANLTQQLTPTKLTHYFKITASGQTSSSALESGLRLPYGEPPHSPLGFDLNFRATGGYSTITKLGVDLQPCPWLQPLAAAPPPLDTPAGPPAKPATPTAVSLDASARVNLSPLNTEADMASYILQRRLTP